MNKLTVTMADITFMIKAVNMQTILYCKDYEAKDGESPLFEIEMTEEDIVEEWKYMLSSGRYSNEFVNHLPGYYFEIFALHKKVAAAMLPYQIYVFHGSAVAVDGRAYLFAAGTGKGKSTHAGLWQQYFGEERAKIINDDKPFMKVEEDRIRVFGSPWAGKYKRHTNMAAALEAVYFIRPSEKNIRKPISYEEAFQLCRQMVLPVKTEQEERVLTGLVSKTLRSVPIYSLDCTISLDAVTTAYQTPEESPEAAD